MKRAGLANKAFRRAKKMLRIVALNLTLLFLPSLIYGVYVYLMRQDAPPDAPLDEAPIFWLFGAGVALMFCTLIYFVQFSGGGKPGQTYFPPTVKDGKVVPGHFE
jgi:TRAP-type C4-dicarboxylate transport system permease small subunit